MLKRSLVLAWCGLSVAGAGVALAAGSATTATIAIRSSGEGDTFHGKVASENAKCVPARARQLQGSPLGHGHQQLSALPEN